MFLRELEVEGAAVDRGTPVVLTAIFNGDPVEVFASFMKPGEGRAIVDPGYGQAGSRIRRVEKDAATGNVTYSYVIDTTGFSTGRVSWHMWGTCDASKFGWFTINDAPAQLL